MRIRPARRLRGRVRVPGDKSVSHRAAILAALARGASRVENFSTAADCASTLACLEGLGVGVRREGGGAVVISGAGRGPGRWAFSEPPRALDCGNSGTTMRLLAGVLAAQPFSSVLAGDESLSRRPMRRVIEPLERMGARVSSVEGRAPLRIEGRRPLRAIEFEPAVASAQVISCVLLAGLGAEGRTSVREPRAGGGAPAARDHTERMLRWLGAPVSVAARDGAARTVSIEGPATLAARDLWVPGDFSSAAFFIAAAALLPGSELEIEGVGLNPTRTALLGVLSRLGAGVTAENGAERCNEPVGNLFVKSPSVLAHEAGGALRLGGAEVARLIDELPLLAVVGALAEGGLEIRDAAELRVKESDRISAVVRNLRAMGAEVEERDDGLSVGGGARLKGARLSSFGDHRIAMAFAVAALAAEGETTIDGARECVSVSFPEFFSLLESVTER
ncbi:MAG TPA: 3-phosphoshikimate 1-carboxyvinyltransferase [Pyrinomonadaceae bacterium]|nr:3-phosphoshikimate 1-carboxyvinyltransferase [Pyrinomonadaceae bacterium]